MFPKTPNHLRLLSSLFLLHKKEKETMDIDTLIERQEVLVENQKQLLSAMVSTLDLMKAEKITSRNRSGNSI